MVLPARFKTFPDPGSYSVVLVHDILWNIFHMYCLIPVLVNPLLLWRFLAILPHLDSTPTQKDNSVHQSSSMLTQLIINCNNLWPFLSPSAAFLHVLLSKLSGVDDVASFPVSYWLVVAVTTLSILSYSRLHTEGFISRGKRGNLVNWAGTVLSSVVGKFRITVLSSWNNFSPLH